MSYDFVAVARLMMMVAATLVARTTVVPIKTVPLISGLSLVAE